MKTLDLRKLSVLVLFLFPFSSFAGQRVKYACDRLSYAVTVEFEKGFPVALYGIETEGDEDGTDPEYAHKYVKLFNLRVGASKNSIYFKVENDFGPGDIICHTANF